MSKITFTLTEDHINKFCKPGHGYKTCAYLGMGQGFECLKYSNLMGTLATKIRNDEMTAKGDNCDALLTEIMNRKKDLVGKKFVWSERNPDTETAGILKNIIRDKSGVWLYFDVKGKDIDSPFGLNTSELQITSTPEIIRFEIAGMGTLTGVATIYL